MSTREDIEEFEEQLRLQKTPVNEDSVTRTRVDSDGTEMEWDEKRKAWFPKIDDDFIARYQMNYGFKNDSAEPDPTQSLVLGDAWSVHARRLEELRRERGESDKEVLALQKASEESLAAYYSSPAYKAWYSMYIKVKGDGTASCDNQALADENDETLEKERRWLQKLEREGKLHSSGHNLAPMHRDSFGRRRLTASSTEACDVADLALARAEEEARLGIPLHSDEKEEEEFPELDDSSDNRFESSIGCQDKLDDVSDSCGITNKPKKGRDLPPPAWYEAS